MLAEITKFHTYLQSRSLSEHTIESYLHDINKFHDYCHGFFAVGNSPLTPPSLRGEGGSSEINHVSISEITPDIIRNYILKLYDENLTSRTISRNITVIRMFFKYLYIYENLAKNPLKFIKNPKFTPKLPRFFTQDEMEKLCSLPDTDTFIGIRDRAILELFYSSGLRISELANMKLQNIDFVEKTVTVIGKGQKRRTVPVTTVAIDFMDKYKKIRGFNVDTDIFFLTKDKKTFTTPKLYKIVKDYIKQIALRSGYSPHTLRHSFASHMLSNGANLMAIKEMLGHASLSSTEVYTHLTPDLIRKEYLEGHPRANKKL